MITRSATERNRIWRCLHCRASLTGDALGFRCTGCDKVYPVIEGVPILVSEPTSYLRSELASLIRASHDARQRRETLDGIRRDVGLTPVSLGRHRDVVDAEIAQTEAFLALLEPAAEVLQQMGKSADESLSVRRSGWSFDSLIPYLLRDWTNTSELQAASSVIGAALKQVFPDPSGKTIALAGSGAGGLLPEISHGFERVLGFDLTLAIVAVARHLLDGKTFGLALPRAIREAGHIVLRKHDGSSASHVEVLAMDAFDTAFADGSVDCIITSFIIDLIPDPRRLAHEIHRVLCCDGVWINYGPSGPLKALWRFDQTECAAFFEAAGFAVVQTEAHRVTYLDVSRDCPSWSFQSHMCYLTSARKTRQPAPGPKTVAPTAAELPDVVPQLFPRANLVQRRNLGPERMQTLVLRQERIPGRPESLEIGNDTAQIIELVDGKRTVREIAALLEQRVPPLGFAKTLRAFAHYFRQSLLTRARPLEASDDQRSPISPITTDGI